jgi:hypothetical protein
MAERKGSWHCTLVRVVRFFLTSCAVGTVYWTNTQFHIHYQFEHHDPMGAFQQSFSKVKPNSKPRLRSGIKNQTGEHIRNLELSMPAKQNHLHIQQQQEQPRIPQQKTWKIPESSPDEFDEVVFEERLLSWRLQRAQYQDEKRQLALQQAAMLPHTSSNSTFKVIPRLHEVPVFQRRFSSDLMVMVMADHECPLVWVNAEGETVNATARLLVTLKDALKTEYADVVAYLPNIKGSENCRDELYQAVVKKFLLPLQIGKLQVITPPQQPSRRPEYKFAQEGLNFAYAAELGHHYSDLYFHLQAGTRLIQEWWIQYVALPLPEGADNTTKPEYEQREVTSHRDYGMEILHALEERNHLDDAGVMHEMCYMNFAKGIAFKENKYARLQHPTGTLFQSSDLMRFSLVLRSFLPYGRFSVSTLLGRYCADLVWEAHTPNAHARMFRYTSKKNNENKLELPKEPDTLLPRLNASTFPYIVPASSEVPPWVEMGASMVGPHTMDETNPFVNSTQNNGMTSTTGAQRSADKVWMTFVIPTAWRHSAAGVTEGNAYTVECLTQLSAIVQEYFTGEYRAMILVLISGRNEYDLLIHHESIEVKFAKEISMGIIQLIRAPIHQYPTLHGLHNHYKDPESRVRWRSKQNLDVSSAFFAAKGYGKYVMLIEDDSGFRSEKFFKGIKQSLSNLMDEKGQNPVDQAALTGAKPRVVRFNRNGERVEVDIGYVSIGNIEEASKNSSMVYNGFGSVKKKGEGRQLLGQKAKNAAIPRRKKVDTSTLTGTEKREDWSQFRYSFGYSGVLVHDEDALVFGMMHFLLYKEKPCDLLFAIANSVRTGTTKDHFLRWNRKYRFITHRGKMSSLEGKVFSDEEIAKG